MNAGTLFGKRTWIGFGVTVAVMMVLLLLGAFVMVREILPISVASPWLWISYGLASLVGGRVAAAGQGREFCALVPGVLLYVLAWLLALCSECSIDFASNGLGITIAVALGTSIAFMRRRKKKKHNSYIKRGKRPAVRTVRR